MTPELQTERLILRPLQLADAERTQLIFPQWEVVKYLNAAVPWPYPDDGAITYYRDVALAAMGRGEEWHWTLRMRRSPEQHIGAIMLHLGEWSNRGFWLGSPWHGQGLMTEAVATVNDYWFDVLGCPVLRALKALPNTASRRISEKTGMRVIALRQHDFVAGRLMAEICEITAEEWQQRRIGSSRS